MRIIEKIKLFHGLSRETIDMHNPAALVRARREAWAENDAQGSLYRPGSITKERWDAVWGKIK